MAGKVAERKARLRAALIEAAEAEIAEGGLEALKARKLAEAAGCSVGAIYNVFDDLDALVMAVNARTFGALGRFVSEKVAAQKDASPQTQMITMAHGYLHFAQKHTNLWRAMFDLEMSAEAQVPEWYQDELRAVFGLIAAPLAELEPEMDTRERYLLVRALFSAVHGVVLLGLERRISAVPEEHMEQMLTLLIGRATQ